MLDQRAQFLLKILIERYIADGQPVGSRALSKYSGLDLSPATIRNVMADLEELGFIASPHTSAGRIPTARGYRFFVDSLMVIKPLDQSEIHKLENQLYTDHSQKLVTSASNLLSELSKFAGIVAVSKRRNTTFRQLEFLRLSEKRILLIVVTQEGDVQNKILFPEKDYTASALTEASNFINQHFSGHTFDEIRARLQTELKQLHQDMSKLMTTALEASSQAITESEETFVISGESNLLHVQELSSNMVNLRNLFDMFEHKTGLLQLLDISQCAQGIQIFIGGESKIVSLDECSVVTAPYEVDGQIVGTLGVIGPTRMAYERIIPIVDITAKLLSNALSGQN